MKESDVPVLGHADGICHIYVDAAADLEMANKIGMNAKVGYKVAVCNAVETLLVHTDTAEKFLPTFCAALHAADVEIRGCERTQNSIPPQSLQPKRIGGQNTSITSCPSEL